MSLFISSMENAKDFSKYFFTKKSSSSLLLLSPSKRLKIYIFYLKIRDDWLYFFIYPDRFEGLRSRQEATMAGNRGIIVKVGERGPAYEMVRITGYKQFPSANIVMWVMNGRALNKHAAREARLAQRAPRNAVWILRGSGSGFARPEGATVRTLCPANGIHSAPPSLGEKTRREKEGFETIFWVFLPPFLNISQRFYLKFVCVLIPWLILFSTKYRKYHVYFLTVIKKRFVIILNSRRLSTTLFSPKLEQTLKIKAVAIEAWNPFRIAAIRNGKRKFIKLFMESRTR